MSTPFVSSLRSSSGSSAPTASAGKTAMLSLFSGLDLALDASGAVVSQAAGGNSAARELLASKGAERQAEAAIAAAQALKRQQQAQQQQTQQEKPVTALTQALGLFDDEMEQCNAFMSRNTQRRKPTGAGRQGKGRGGKATSDGKDSKKIRGGPASKGRRRRQEKYKHV